MMWPFRSKPKVTEPAPLENRILIFPADISNDFLVVDAANEITNLGNIERLDMAVSMGSENVFRLEHRDFYEKHLMIRPADRLVLNPVMEFWDDLTKPGVPQNASWLLFRSICAVMVWNSTKQPECLKIALDPDMPEEHQIVLAGIFIATEGVTVFDKHTGENIPISFSGIA